MKIDDTIDFYNKESDQYSKKRYEGDLLTYFQFLFRRRRELFLSLVGSITPKLKGADALEIGCADGVLIKKIFQKFPSTFESVVGIDISEGMLETARASTHDTRASYFLRGNEPQKTFGLVIELGVHAESFEEEMKYVSGKLSPQGYFIYSAAGRNSLHAKIKLKDKKYAGDYLTYSGYEKIMNTYFDIISSEAYGLFVPKLWAFPWLARKLQPVLEYICKPVAPSLFHEKIYLLRKKA